MFIVENYPLAVLFCVITMLCRGSWANTQKLVHGKWRFELFYWDYVSGILLFSLVAAFTIGSAGAQGRSFIPDLQQALPENMLSAFVGGIIFNLVNILLTAAIAIAGMSVAFPVDIGIALILGVIINYIALEKGNPALLAAGIVLITAAIILNARTYSVSSSANQSASLKGIAISVVAGILMSLFYRFVAASMDLENFVSPAAGKMTPYTASVIFAIGILSSNFIFNTVIMRRPIQGTPVSYQDYFSGKAPFHLTGILGGSIWALGNLCNLIAVDEARGNTGSGYLGSSNLA